MPLSGTTVRSSSSRTSRTSFRRIRHTMDKKAEVWPC
jgi:hypothetical protein